MTQSPIKEQIPIAVRAYVEPVSSNTDSAVDNSDEKKDRIYKEPKPSQWALVFDTETTTDASQNLRIGTYQIHKAGDLVERGLFYDPVTLTSAEQKTLRIYAANHTLKLLTVDVFIEEVFFFIGYQFRGHVIGFNLPFDLSRLAIDHDSARGVMLGGFTFKLSERRYRPHVQIKHLSARDSIIRFSALMKLQSKGDVKKKRRYQHRRGFFVDVKTLAAALTSQSYSLESLARYLEISSQKHKAEHGKTLTNEYIEYALQDTQTTWECYEMLTQEYNKHGLGLTPLHKIHSEASIGKAYLKEMGVKPWREMQPDFPTELLGIIASSYYGGRSEVHIRRQIVQVLYCDFLSMYPTVCTLMNLWHFVIAERMEWKDCTLETKRFLKTISLDDLQKPETWRSLCVLVQVKPQGEIYPVRARYGDDAQYTIGTNHLESDHPLWYTLADCINAKLLSGKTPKIIRAIVFSPGKTQKDLCPVNISGNEDYRLDPYEGDFFKRLIDLRTQIKKQKTTSPVQKKQLHSQQLALKILANATSYGIFIEILVKQNRRFQNLLCHGPLEENPFTIRKKKTEIPGTYFHPLLATLITGAARLMLAITESLTLDAGLDWAFCDTDSMALAKPERMPEQEFYKKAKYVQEWFTPLNPYANKQPLFKIEDANYHPNTGKLYPLYCLAISSKRYALFNLDTGTPRLRKVSAHGLGHLIVPYQREKTPFDLGDVKPWQQDFWMEIIKADLRGKPDMPSFSKLPSFDIPAVSQYAATTPQLERWFKKYNETKDYRDKVRAFNFLLAAQKKGQSPIAPYSKNIKKAMQSCIDRNTGHPIVYKHLKTYRECLNQYHLHPESKFLGGDCIDRGTTQRRYIKVSAIQHVGKEASQWEEQYFLGFNPDAQIEYGSSKEQTLRIIQEAKKTFGLRRLARVSEIAIRHLNNVIRGRTEARELTLAKIYKAINSLSVGKTTMLFGA